MSSAVVSLVKVIPLPQFGRWIPVSDIMTGVDRGVGRDLMCQVVDLRSGREPNKALVGVGSLSSQGLYRKGSP